MVRYYARDMVRLQMAIEDAGKKGIATVRIHARRFISLHQCRMCGTYKPLSASRCKCGHVFTAADDAALILPGKP